MERKGKGSGGHTTSGGCSGFLLRTLLLVAIGLLCALLYHGTEEYAVSARLAAEAKAGREACSTATENYREKQMRAADELRAEISKVKEEMQAFQAKATKTHEGHMQRMGQLHAAIKEVKSAIAEITDVRPVDVLKKKKLELAKHVESLQKEAYQKKKGPKEKKDEWSQMETNRSALVDKMVDKHEKVARLKKETETLQRNEQSVQERLDRVLKEVKATRAKAQQCGKKQ